MKNLASHLYAVAIVLWVGSLWAIGLIAAPTLFSVLKENTQLAGLLAGKMFTLTAYAGMACGFYVLIYRLAAEGTGAFKQWFFWIALAMLALTLAGHFGVQPIIQSLKVEGGAAEVMKSVVADRFARWHGIASILYVIQSLLGLMLVLKQR
ncbi:MAG: DUF4149 domain-containing protein [Hydrogenophilales bacterium]|nr:DUF4149 domain-containing protein [Hydrogenophilales bacterium]